MSNVKVEQLTDEEREALSEIHEGCVALRIIDDHAAGVAALVAQLEALRSEVTIQREAYEDQRAELQRAEAQVAELTRERDEARENETFHRDHAEAYAKQVTRLTEALAAAEASHLCPCGEKEARLIAAEARVRELEGLRG